MDILGITIWREARGEGSGGMMGVYNVIRNRVSASPKNGWSNDPEKVCLQPYQFSCWNTNDPQRNLYPTVDDLQYQKIKAFFDPAISVMDNTGGATGYFDDSIKPPVWATQNNFTKKIGSLNFYKL